MSETTTDTNEIAQAKAHIDDLYAELVSAQARVAELREQLFAAASLEHVVGEPEPLAETY